MRNIDPQLQFLAGGGENGELIRSFDWAKTSLGNPQNWPKSLKTCVRIILTSRQPMFVWWGAELINIYNDAYQAIVGGKHPWAMGKPASEVWKEIWEQVGPRADTALKTNEGTYDESLLLIMERNGYPEETYYTFSYSPVPGDNGEPEGIICANTDDTQRILSARQLLTLTELGKAFDESATDDDIFTSTINILKKNPRDFPFVLIYKAAENNFELAGQSDFISEGLSPDRFTLNGADPWQLKQAINGLTMRVIDTTNADLPTGAWSVPPKKVLVLPLSKSGQQQAYGAMVIGISPYRLLEGQYLSFFTLVVDQIATGLSNVRAYEEERKRIAALLEIDKAKTVFFNNVSHEFRTPLTLMLGPVEELIKLKDETLPAVFKENINSIYRNAQRLLKLVNNLLEFSRIEAGRVQAMFRPVDLASLTADLASGFRSIIEKAGLQFNVLCEPLSQPVYVDVEMWEKIVLNLLSNAFKYTLEGSITLSLKNEDYEAVLEVSDTGVGIPAEELPRMFERFHRVPGTAGRTHEGTGIGLSLISELIKMHHGEIEVSSEEGKGSTFTVRIPIGKAHLPQEQVSEAKDFVADSGIAGAFVNEAQSLLANEEEVSLDEISSNADILADRDQTVLVVDDNPDMRAYLKRLLDPYYTVITASNGREALDILPDTNVGLVVSDIMMPGIDGQEMVKQIRSNPDLMRLPVILLSARAGEEARIEGLEAGADDYLVKPFSAKELLTKVRSQINIAQSRNHAEELLKELFLNAPMAIAIMRGENFVIDLVNDHVIELWGRPAEQLLNRPALEAMPELEGQGIIELLQGVYHTGERYITDEKEVFLLRKGILEKIYVKFVYEPLRDEKGNVTGVIALGHEITDLVNARHIAQDTAEEMRQLVKQKDEFMSIASHELKTPVTSMKAILQILERMNVVDEKVAGFINKASKQMNRLTLLVSDLLDVSSLHAGKMKFYPEQFKLGDMLSEVIEQHQQSQHTHRIIAEGDGNVTITGDRSRLEQVLNNLVSNAIKYSPDADEVIVAAETSDGAVKISVKDKGIGIPDEKMPHVFERFFRVEESGNNFSGLGLGLYISEEIVKRHNGTIGVEKNGDKGSLFWFTLPLNN